MMRRKQSRAARRWRGLRIPLQDLQQARLQRVFAHDQESGGSRRHDAANILAGVSIAYSISLPKLGLVVILHNDIVIPIARDVAKDESEPAYLNQLKVVFKRHAKTTIMWAHMGLGRLVAPPKEHLAQIEAILRDPDFHNAYLDISWDEVAKYFVASPEASKSLADLMQFYPDRFLFGSDAAAPADRSKYLKAFYQYGPLWKSLDAETSREVRLRNYERMFDEAHRTVRSWENAHLPSVGSN